MMQPRIQYTKTKDGVSIAFWVMGEGEPFVHVPIVPFGHMQLEWQMEEVARWYEGLAQERMLIGYDRRGTGLSQRDVADYSLDAQVLDLEAIVEHLRLKQVVLFAGHFLIPAAITYAACHPDKVKHLLLWCAQGGSPVRPTPVRPDDESLNLLEPLIEADWERYTGTVIRWLADWDSASAGEYAALMREGSTPESFKAYNRARAEFDVGVLLQQVRSPTLVIHPRGAPGAVLDAARELASGLTDSRLVVLEEPWWMPWEDPTRSVMTVIDEFLSEGEEEAAGIPVPGGFATILFMDIESSTALTQQLGDAKAQEVRRTHNEIVRGALSARGGNEIKHTGDGIMASFATASAALECAIAIQQGVASHKAKHADSPLGVYVGLNAGEPIVEDDDLFGTSVDLAARLVDHAEPGQIIASDIVRQLAAGKDFLFADLGETELRGFEDPVKLWELRWQENG